MPVNFSIKTVIAVLKDILRCYAPFLLILLAFSSLKFFVPYYGASVEYDLMPHLDKLLVGNLATTDLQRLLWHGHVQWYDFLFYGFYAAHYVLVVLLAWLVYKLRRSEYNNFSFVYVLLSLSAFMFFIFYPTAPPWLASENGYIPHIARISGAVYSGLGVHNYPGLYNQVSPDAVAAFPSLHAAYAVLFSI